MKKIPATIYLTISLLLMVQISIADEVIEKSFSVSQGGWLKLQSDLGSIEIKSHNSSMVEVEVIKKSRSFFGGDDEELLKSFEVTFEQNGNDIYIYGKFENGRSRRRSHLNVRYIITVPEKYNIDLNTSGGSISVDDLQGEVIGKTSGGSLEIGHINGPINGKTSGGSISVASSTGKSELNTSGGSISIGDAEGNLEAHTSGGSITLNSANGDIQVKTSGGGIDVHELTGNINAETSGGSIKCLLKKQPSRDCSLKTSGGSVTVYMPEGTAVNIDAKTSGGHVKCDHEITIKGKIDKSSLVGKINGGGPNLYLRTSGGNINIGEM